MKNLAIGFIALFGVVSVRCSYEDFLCGKDPSKVFAPCNEDCKLNHAGSGGKCGNVNEGDFNCYCEGVGTRLTINDESLNCAHRSDSVRNVCTMDCLCNHAALGGYCNFAKKACICSGVGLNKRNLNCPAKSVYEFAVISENYMGPNVLGAYGQNFVEKSKLRFPPKK